jgi:hypothetical protein
MPAPSKDKRQAVADIERHLSRDGAQNWREIRKRYAHVPEATFWRWVGQAKKKLADPVIIEEARQKFAERAAETTAEERIALAASHLPRAPSPDYLAKSGAQAIVNIDLLDKFQKLYDDALKLRDYSTTEEDKIRNPLFFTHSINARDRILNTALNAMNAIWNLRRMQALYDAILGEIGKVSPEMQIAVIDRLADLDRQSTFAARA